MNTLPDKCLKVGEEVIVIAPEHPMYNEIGQIYRLRSRDGLIKVSVIFDGEVYACDQDQLGLA